MGDTSRQGRERERERDKNARISFKCLYNTHDEFRIFIIKVIANETLFHIISTKKWLIL